MMRYGALASLVILTICSHARSQEPLLLDPLPQPSHGSGAPQDPDPQPRWAVLDDLVESDAPPLLRSDQPGGAIAGTPLPDLQFDGVVATPFDPVPPDTHIAVGPGIGGNGRVVMVTNGSAAIWTKDAVTVAFPVDIDIIFGVNAFDPKVHYDQHSGRFFIVALEGNNDPSLSNIHIAVSQDATPNTLFADWTLSQATGLTSIDGIPTWADYPGIGSDANALYVTTNQFGFPGPTAGFRGVKIRVYEKGPLFNGVQQFFDFNLDNAVAAQGTTMPAHVYGTTDTGGFYLFSRLGSTTYRKFHITGAPFAPALTSSTHNWSAGSFPVQTGAEQDPTPFTAAPRLDTLSTRVQNAVYRNGHAWLCLTADPDDDGETEVVWQKIATNSNNPSIAESGFIDGTGIEPWTYMPCINVNNAGAAAICYTQSSAVRRPGVYYTMRSADDPPNTFRTPVTVLVSQGFYWSFVAPLCLDNFDCVFGGFCGPDGFCIRNDRWGDYSACVVDPSDDRFWVANEYAFTSQAANSRWGTRVAAFSPSPVCQPGCDNINVACLSGPEFANRQPVGQLVGGGFCTAWIVAEPNVVMTSASCVANGINGLSVVFNAECDSCTEGSFLVTENFPVTELIHDSSLLDYALLRVAGNPASRWGVAAVNPEAPVVGQEIYSISHGGGQTKSYEAGFVTSVENIPGSCDSSVLVDMEVTTSASSGARGAPIFRADDHCVIGLAHCGDECESGAAVPMMWIWSDAVPRLKKANATPAACKPPSKCPADLNGDGEVEVPDLVALILAWGPCDGCPEDIDGDGEVEVSDLVFMITNWGPCP